MLKPYRFLLSIPVLSVFLFAQQARSELGEDIHIQETGEIRIDIDRLGFDNMAKLFDLGYPPATVMMHAVSTGMSLNDIVYIAVKSDVTRAKEFYDTAISLLPSLPGWVCQAASQEDRYTQSVDLSDLGEQPSVQKVAQLFFENDQRLTPFPDWIKGRVHMTASVDELAELVSEEHWYVPGHDDGTPLSNPNRPVFISLYKTNNEIIVDQGVERIREAQRQGKQRLPVVLVYNNFGQRPISDFEESVTVRQLADLFYDEGLELTSVPEWHVGDYHKLATIGELKEVVDIPRRNDVNPERWSELEESIVSNGMQLSEPLLVTLLKSGEGGVWVDNPETVSVAADLGLENLPVVLFYHEIDREPCGQTSSSCEDRICQAVTAAGAPAGACQQSLAQQQASLKNSSENADELRNTVGFSADSQVVDGSYGSFESKHLCTS